MNERIKELVKEAGLDDSMFPIDEWDNPELEKFAALIVRETLRQMAIQIAKAGDEQSNNPAWYKAEEAVKKQLGVEE